VGGELDVQLTDGRLEGSWSQGGRLAIVLVRDPDFDALAASPPPPALTAAYLAELRAASRSPALAAAARRRDGALIGAVDGLRQAGEEALATIEDLWHLGSITKSMTSTLVALLVEDGALSWETTVGEALGAAVPDMRDDHRDANLLHLLSHRAALRPNVGTLSLLRFPLEEDDPRGSRIAWAAEALADRPVGTKGESFLYSNSGYVVAGAMIEARLGAPWESVIAERLFAPLGLASAGFGAPGAPGELDQPVGHSLGVLGGLGLSSRRIAHPPGTGRTDNPAVLGPAGRVHMSLLDLLTFLEAHRDRSPLLSAEGWDRLHTPPFGAEYALGLIRRPDGALWHNGSNTIWYAEVLIDPARGVVAAAAANDGAVAASAPAVGSALLAAAATAAG
jgi:CubicO group peptidase (beta-lactamase class C family)